jgi:SAM-dependent methyltransferase
MTVQDFYDDFVDYELAYLRHPNRRHRRVREHLRPLLERTPKAALDVGCGIGLMSAWLGRRVPRVVGVDVSPRSIEVCRQLHLRGELGGCLAEVAAPPSHVEGETAVVAERVERVQQVDVDRLILRVGEPVRQ